MIKTIPLNRLVASSGNVRRSSDAQADAELKADIESRGLLQNLVVTSLARPRGRFAVEAGERRRRALQSLADEGKLPHDHPVSCLVVDNAGAQEASLAENFQRLAMNPADECLAFQQLVEQGSDPEAIARRFGVTVRFVEGRLRLADLAPPVFEALGAGEIGLDIAKAYAATADRERQAHVFEQVSRSYMAHHPDTIRRMMTSATLGAGDRRVLFVGEEAYVAAGGRIERDLFSDEGEVRWLDVPLVERLAAEKLEAIAEDRKAEAGLAWVRALPGDWIGYGDTEGLRRLDLESPSLTDEEAAELDLLESEVAGLAGTIDDGDADPAARDMAERRTREISDRMDAIVSKPPVLPGELKGLAGAFLLLDRNGRAILDTRRFVEETLDPDEAEADEDVPVGEHKAASTLSRRLTKELSMQRRDILAVHVAADRDFAFDLAAFLIADGRSNHGFEPSGSSLRSASPSDPAPDHQLPGLAAPLALSAADEALDRSWTTGNSRAERFDAFRALPEAARRLWFSLGIGRTLEASANVAGPHGCAFHDHLGQLLGIEVSKWWRPVAATYFDRVPKSMALEALGQVGGTELANRYAKLKKAELAEACERIFAGDVIAEAEVKAAALAWVPEAMRFAGGASFGAPAPDGEVAGPDACDSPQAEDGNGQLMDQAA